jgi:non-specific serine/threonine protein kinase
MNTMLEELPQFNPRKRGMKVRYPPDMAKSILKQALQALAFLNSNGIAHGDFQPGNMLFALDHIDSIPEDALRQEEDEQAGSISAPVQRLDGKQDEWAPRYLCIAQSLVPFTNYANCFKIKLSDMGGGQYLPTQSPVSLFLLPEDEYFYLHRTMNSILLHGATTKTRDSPRPSGPRIDSYRRRW